MSSTMVIQANLQVFHTQEADSTFVSGLCVFFLSDSSRRVISLLYSLSWHAVPWSFGVLWSIEWLWMGDVLQRVRVTGFTDSRSGVMRSSYEMSPRTLEPSSPRTERRCRRSCFASEMLHICISARRWLVRKNRPPKFTEPGL